MYGLGESDDLGRYSSPSLSKIKRAIDGFLNTNPRTSVRIKSVVAHEDPIAQFRTLNTRFNDSTIEVDQFEDHHRVSVSRKIKRSGRRVSGSFAIFNHKGTQVWSCLTGHDKDFFERGLNWVISQSEPRISEFYATSGDLETVLEHFDEAVGGGSDIVVTKAVAYSHREEGEISFKKRPYPVVFRDAREGRNYIDSLEFEAVDEELRLEATITRNGETQISGGNVELFFNYLLEDYVSFAQRKAELFQNKERSADTGDIQEIEIKFQNPVFQSTKDNEDLIAALADLPRSSIAVYHKNPYAHISVLDFNDGSSCDVFVTDARTISLVPSYIGSTNFLMRISDKLYKDMDESTIEIVERQDYGVEDFIGG